MVYHVICERDVGLFSLIQQVIAHLPWALQENRVPIACFGSRTCYWTAKGYAGGDTVWEYYFEPLDPAHPVASLPDRVRQAISARFPSPFEVGYFADPDTFVSAHFGDHPELAGKALSIPYLVDDPDDDLRRQTAELIERYVRPREYILQKVDRFYRQEMDGGPVIGVHARGTDAVSSQEVRPHRRGSLILARYRAAIERLLEEEPTARIFVATDDQASLDYLDRSFPGRVLACDSTRHRGGEAAGHGPTGWVMPAYIAEDPDIAARNGEEAVVEYLLLARCRHLVHNGGSLARTVLLCVPDLPHTNVHGQRNLVL